MGAGPCGLACARELQRLGHDEFLIMEAADGPGGLAASVVDPAGFTWDRGGHVVFSHYGEFDKLLTDVMAGDLLRHDRSSYIRIAGGWVPYPFQNNLHRLPPALVEQAVVGLVEAAISRSQAVTRDDEIDAGAEVDFETWMNAMFGRGIVEQFMRPYNEKVWAHPASTMSSQWMAERVATVDWRLSMRSVFSGHDDVAWGPNNQFSFPACGGTGEIYRRAAATVAEHITYGDAVRSVDAEGHAVITQSGRVLAYDAMLWTGPLDRLVEAIPSAPDGVRAAATELVHNSVTIVGVGYETPLADDRSWLYFPEADVPFYRATNFAKYSPNNVPGGDTSRFSSWMTEIASSPDRPLADRCSPESLGARVDRALREVGLVDAHAPVASVHVEHLPYGYPVPTLGRDDALRTIQPWLSDRDILSRGRFGAWRYELGNMDHAVKMGVDAARRLACGAAEQAWVP